MSHTDDLPDPRLTTMLDTLRETEPRAPHMAAQQRAAFLSEAKEMAQGVSPQPFFRLNKWRAALNQIFAAPRKEQKLMFKTIIAFAVVATLFTGGGMVAAAQSSLPDDTLYPIKIWTEDAQISLTGSEQDQFQLDLEFAARRMQEIQSLLQEDKIPSQQVLNRFENLVQNAMVLAANMPDEAATASLLQIQTQLQTHEQVMAQYQFVDTEPEMQQVRTRIQNMLELHLGLAQAGAEDPQWLRRQLQAQEQEQNLNGGNPWTTGTPTPGSGYGEGNGSNPWTTGTPTPGSGYGPGDSQNPWTTGTPTPGSGYGPGEPQNPEATPQSAPGNGNGDGGNGNHP